jgi:hypothetical protein
MVRYRFAQTPLSRKPKPLSVPVVNTIKIEIKEEEKPIEIKIIDGRKFEIYKYKL